MNSSSVISDLESGDGFYILRGLEVSSVEFVCDYVRIHFDDAIIAFINPVYVTGNIEAREGGPGFRDAICSIIGKKADDVCIVEDMSMDIKFGETTVSVSLKPDDYLGPEAATLFCRGSFSATI